MATPPEEQNNAIENAGKMLPSLKDRGTAVPRRQFADIIESTLRGAQGGIAASSQAAQFGDPLTAFLAGASGAASGPTPGEVALERLETEPIGNVSPGLADMMAQMGVEDAHNLPLGAVKRMAPAIQAAGQMQQAQQKAFLNKRIEKSDIPFWASATGLTEEQAEKAFLKKTPFEVTTAFQLRKSLRGTAAEQNVFNLTDVNALIAAEESKLGRPLSSSERLKFMSLLGASRTIRTNILPAASRPASPFFIAAAIEAGAKVVDKTTGEVRKATASDFVNMNDIQARALVTQIGKRVNFIDDGNTIRMLVTNRQGRTEDFRVIAQSKDLNKFVKSSISEFNEASASLEILMANAKDVLLETDPQGPLDIREMASRGRRGVQIFTGAILKTDPAAVRFMKSREAFLSKLTRASGQSGVLTDRDVDMIRGAMPFVFDSQASAAASMSGLRDLFFGVVTARLKLARQLGINTGEEMTARGLDGLDYDAILKQVREQQVNPAFSGISRPATQFALPGQRAGQDRGAPQAPPQATAPSINIPDALMEKLRGKGNKKSRGGN